MDMKDPNRFKKVKRPKPAQPPKGRLSQEGFQALLARMITSRFERLSGLTVAMAQLGWPGAEADEIAPQAPAHPACAEFADSEYCRRSWQSHLSELRRRPEVHWHSCIHGKRCAVVPVVWQKQCLVACQLVCPGTMDENEFERLVELLDVLIENFILRESDRLSREIPAVIKSADHDGGSLEDLELERQEAADHPQVAAALRYIKRHLTDSKLTVGNLAGDLGVNATYLAHLFSLQVGMRMSRYIALRRIELAKQLLTSTDWQIKRVAFETGHGNPYWFSEVFREHTGLTPSKYRHRAANA